MLIVLRTYLGVVIRPRHSISLPRDQRHGDMDGNGRLDFDDIRGFVDALNGVLPGSKVLPSRASQGSGAALSAAIYPTPSAIRRGRKDEEMSEAVFGATHPSPLDAVWFAPRDWLMDVRMRRAGLTGQ